MRAVEQLHRGTHQASGVIFDLQIVGESTARKRVLKRWQQGASLYRLSNDHWLLKFAAETTLNSVHAGGSIVVRDGNGLAAAPALTAEPEQLVWWFGGEQRRSELAKLEMIDPSEWIDLGVQVRPLAPVGNPSSVEVVEPTPPPPTANLRRVANVAELSTEAQRFIAAANADPRSGRRRTRNLSGGADGPGTAHSRKPRGSGAIARLVLRSPLQGQLRRRHERYLSRLERQFNGGDLDEALRNAIPLGGLEGSALTLRLPQRRQNLRLTQGQTNGGSLSLGPTVHRHLQEMYRRAATELEASDRIDEAAFVLSELLNNPAECVALFERHRRFQTAASLAEARNLDPELTVRLWWLAGDRPRAMRLARQSHVYASVLDRLEQSDPEAAHDFRLLWVDQLERSGNICGAVAVGWPDTQIRPLLTNTIERGILADDDWSLGLQAYRVGLHPSEQNRTAFKAALAENADNPTATRFMTDALAQAEAVDPVADREICSEAIRLLTQLPPQESKALAASVKRIRNRADPTLAADLPVQPAPGLGHVPLTIASRPPGALAPSDVLPQPNGRAIVAMGELGVRLVAPDGQTIARWPAPCHHLVAADHGQSVILLAERQPILEVSVLDLVTRKTRHYGPVRTTLWAKTFDGVSWAAEDDRGIVFYDMLADSPTIAWRELEPTWTCQALQRSPSSLAAIVSIPADVHRPQNRTELWCWDLPKMRLAQKRQIEPVEDTSRVHLLSDATSIWERESTAPLNPMIVTPTSPQPEALARSAAEIRTSGNLLATRCDDLVVVSAGHHGPALVEWECDDDRWDIRLQGLRLALWSNRGRASLVDIERSRVLGALAIS